MRRVLDRRGGRSKTVLDQPLGPLIFFIAAWGVVQIADSHAAGSVNTQLAGRPGSCGGAIGPPWIDLLASIYCEVKTLAASRSVRLG